MEAVGVVPSLMLSLLWTVPRHGGIVSPMRDPVQRGIRATRLRDLRRAKAELARMARALLEIEELTRLAMQAGQMSPSSGTQAPMKCGAPTMSPK